MPEVPDTSVQCWTSLPPCSFPCAVGACEGPRHPAGKGSASPLFTLLPLLEDMKRKTEPAHGHACYPQDVLPTNQKTFKHLCSTNMIKPLSSLYALKQHWGHNAAFGLNIRVDLQTAGPLETVNGNNFVSRWQSQPLPNCSVLQPSTSQAHTNQLFNVGMSWRSSTHLGFPSSGAVYPHLLHGPYLWFIAIIPDFRVTMWRPYVLVKHQCLGDFCEKLIFWFLEFASPVNSIPVNIT